jgi:hypothetical protein
MSLANLRPVSKCKMNGRAFVQCAMCNAVAWSHPRKLILKVLSSEMDQAEISFI